MESESSDRGLSYQHWNLRFPPSHAVSHTAQLSLSDKFFSVEQTVFMAKHLCKGKKAAKTFVKSSLVSSDMYKNSLQLNLVIMS